MLGLVRHQKHGLILIAGGRPDVRDPRIVRHSRRYDRLFKTVLSNGQRVILSAIPPGDGAA